MRKPLNRLNTSVPSDPTFDGIAHFVERAATPGDDQITGDTGNNALAGGKGNDSLSGGAGSDSLSGGAGSDLLKGGRGDDVLTGGAGSDTLDGGAGADRFVVLKATDSPFTGLASRGSGQPKANGDVITAFKSGSDRLDLSKMERAAGIDFVFGTVTTKGVFSSGNVGVVTNEVGKATVLVDSDGDGKADYGVAVSKGIPKAADIVGLDRAPDVVATAQITLTAGAPAVAFPINAGDLDGDTLSYRLAPAKGYQSGLQPSQGKVVFDQATGTFTYTPNAGVTGTDQFDVIVSDGKGGWARQSVTVTIAAAPTNAAPVAAATASLSVGEDSVSTARSVGATDADTGDTLTYVLGTGTNAPKHGTVDLKADGTYTYQGIKDYNGTDSFTITVSDGHGGIATQTVTVTVTPVNDAPVVAASATLAVDEGQLSQELAIVGSDGDGDGLTYTASTLPLHGVLAQASSGRFTYQASGDYNGPDSFVVTVSDGKGGTATQTVNVTVRPVNDAPVLALSASLTVDEGTLSEVRSVGATDVDTGDTLTYRLGTDGNAPQHGTVTLDVATGQYTYQAQGDYVGSDRFTIIATDGQFPVMQTVNVTVNPVNDALTGTPAAVLAGGDEDQTDIVVTDQQLLLGLADVDGALSIPNAPTADHGSFVRTAANDGWVYVPQGDYNGLVTITYAVRDAAGGVTTGLTNSFTLAAVNDDPTGPATGTLHNGALHYAVSEAELLAGIVDADGDTPVVEALDSLQGTFARDAQSGLWVFTPDASVTGLTQISVEITVNDGKGGLSVFDRSFVYSTRIEIDSLAEANGFVIQGVQEYDGVGISAARAGDVNGDGFVDIVIGAPRHHAPGNDYAGAAYVVLGGSGPFGTATPGANGSVRQITATGALPMIAQGDEYDQHVGWSVSSAGDINGDGFADAVIGAPETNYGYGAAYVLFGSSNGLATSGAGGPDSDQGFIISGTVDFNNNGSRAGWSVAAIGDINGDGIHDLLIGAPDGSGGLGAAYVVYAQADGNFGTLSGSKRIVDLELLNDNQGLVIKGPDSSARLGRAVASAGDINGDGLSDIAIRDVGSNLVHIVFGQTAGIGMVVGEQRVLDLSLQDSAAAFRGDRILLQDYEDAAGTSVASIGDFDGDGIDDLIVGAPDFAVDGVARGAAYVVLGRQSFNAQGSVNLPNLPNDAGFRIIGAASGAKLGYSVSSAGDVNGDGLADLIVGAPGGKGADGKSYVVFGSSDPVGTPGMGGIRVLDLSNGLTLDQGFEISGGASARAGLKVSAAGDINGDGYDDLLVGAPDSTDNDVQVGEVAVIYGSNFGKVVAALDLQASLQIDGEKLLGTWHDDQIHGIGTADIVRVGAGNDTLGIFQTGFGAIDGGNGHDTLEFNNGVMTLDFAQIPVSRLRSIEAVNLGVMQSTLKLGARDVLALSDDVHDGRTTLTVMGGNMTDDQGNVVFTDTLVFNDDRDLADANGWVLRRDADNQPMTFIDSDDGAYHMYNDTRSGASVMVATDIDVQGFNRAPILTSGNFQLNSPSFTADDLLLIWTDPDGDAMTISNLVADSGSLVQTGATYDWTNIDNLAPGEEVRFSFDISDGHGAIISTSRLYMI